MTDDPDPHLLAEARRTAEGVMRGVAACERALIALGYAPKPGDAAAICEAIHWAQITPPSDPTQ